MKFLKFSIFLVLVFAFGTAKATLTRTRQGPNFVLYSATAISAAATGSSDVFPAEPYTHGVLQTVWADATSANTATFRIEASLDSTNWLTVSGSSTATTGTSGSTLVDLTTVPGAKLRVTVTEAGTAGSTITPYFLGRGDE